VEAPQEILALVRSLFISLPNSSDCQKFRLSPRLRAAAGVELSASRR
jgi:hypothetical protein